jgi:hypothetical protein
MQRAWIVVTLVLFSALSAVALWQHGYWGIIEPHFRSFGAARRRRAATLGRGSSPPWRQGRSGRWCICW